MKIDDTTAVPTPVRPRREARRRARLTVAVYALCLVILVLAGSYLAPASALDAPTVPNGGFPEVPAAIEPGARTLQAR